MPGCRSRERRLKIALARSSAELHQLSLPQSGVATVLYYTHPNRIPPTVPIAIQPRLATD